MRRLTRTQRRALEEFAAFGISLEQLRTVLGDAIEVDFGRHERRVLFHYDNRKPTVRIELRHIRDEMDKRARGEITTEQLSDWAAMLLADRATTGKVQTKTR
jgi:hypothetical protein